MTSSTQWGPPPPMYGPSQASLGAQYQNEMYARCARGDHDVSTRYGICGIICAVALFPCGLLCLLADRQKRCSRCGSRVR